MLPRQLACLHTHAKQISRCILKPHFYVPVHSSILLRHAAAKAAAKPAAPAAKPAAPAAKPAAPAAKPAAPAAAAVKEAAKPAAVREKEPPKVASKPKRPKKTKTLNPRTIFPNGFLACVPATDVVKPALTSMHIAATAANQTDEHEGLFYRVSPEAQTQLYGARTFHPDVREFLLTMRECSIMVRRPFLELKSYLERASYAHPVIRYLIWGQAGNGKNFTIAHALDYFHERKWFILHFPYLIAFNKFQGNLHDPTSIAYQSELRASVTKPGKIDVPLYSVELLHHFARQNDHLFKDAALSNKLITSQRYEWTKRESTEAGSSLLAIIDHGIQRPAHANDCVNALLREMKQISPETGVKAALVVNMVNALYAPTRLEFDGLIVDPWNVSLFDELKSALKADWKNGACVCTVESEEVMTETLDHYSPRRLLKREGWDLLDPFMPIEVPRLSDEQVHTLINYYLETKWLQHPGARTELGQQELRFLSGNSPHELYTMCGGL